MNEYFLTTVLFILGLIVGSFLNVVILRLPAGEKITGRSHCPKCHKILSPHELVPVFSFIFLKGKCARCGKKISYRYPVLELVTAILFTIAGSLSRVISVSDALILVHALVVISFAITVFVIDLEHYLILDKVIFPVSALLGIILILLDATNRSTFLESQTVSGLLAAFVAFVFFGSVWLFSQGRWMGLGDVKFMIPFGLALGFPVVFVGLFLAFILGAVAAIPLLLLGKKTLASRVPFGTFLSVSLVLTLFFGSSILDWYLGLIGLS